MIAKGTIISFVAIAAMVAITLWTGAQFGDAERIPVHFGLNGEPDRWGDKGEAMFALWFLIGTSAFTAMLLAFAPSFLPRKANVVASGRSYLIMWSAVMVIMVLVTACVAASMIGYSNLSTRILIGGIAAFLALIGNYFPKTRSNWVIGVRTPWTLSSETSWNATHRLAGRLFVFGGIAILIVAIFAPMSWLISAMLIYVIGTASVAIIYSYVVWRTADDKIGEPDLID